MRDFFRKYRYWVIAAVAWVCGGNVHVYAQQDPRAASMLYLEAVVQRNAGRNDAAYDLLRLSLEKDSLASEVYYELAPYEVNLGNDSLAGEYLRKAVSLSPVNSDYLERLGRYYIQTQRFNEAVGVYEQLSETCRQRTDILEMLISLYQQLDDIDNIVHTIDRLIEKEGSSSELTAWETASRFQLLQQSFKSQDWTKAEEICRGGVKYNTEEVAFYYYLGMLCYQRQDEDAALETYEKAVKHFTDRTDRKMGSEIWSTMGDLLHQRKKVEEAYAAYDRALEMNPDNVGCLNNYAYFLSEENRELAKAEEMSRKAIEQEPENPTYLDTYAWIQHLLGNSQVALEYMEKAMSLLDGKADKKVYRKHLKKIRKAHPSPPQGRDVEPTQALPKGGMY